MKIIKTHNRDFSNYYINKEDSNVIKGVLMLLIILGHNHILVPTEETLFHYLYSFHLVCFFILPYFYNKELSYSWNSIKSLIRRLLIPYTVFFVFCLLVSSVIVGIQHKSFLDIAKGYIIGSPYTLRNSVGFIFLWFLPSFFSFSLIRIIGERFNRINQLLLLLSFSTCFLSFSNQESLKNLLPVGIMFAMKFYWMGCACFYLIKYSQKYIYVWPILFIIITYLFWNNYLPSILSQFMPIFAFCGIVALLPFLRNRFLIEIGRYSLGIYLIHVFLLSFLQKIVPNNILGGIISYFTSLLFAYVILKVIYRTKIDRFIFPR